MDYKTPEEDLFQYEFDPLVERLAFLKDKYGDNYPIILYEPSINCQEKKALKDLVKQNSSIHLFDNFRETLQFAQSLGVSFILIVSKSFDEKTVLHNLQGIEYTYGRGMFDFEEEALLKDLFIGVSEDVIKSFKVKAYVFITFLDLMTESSLTENEEEVMVTRDVKEMAKDFRQDFIVIWYDPKGTSEKKSQLEKEIETNIDQNNIFIDFAELYQKIKNYTGIPYHLILSEKDEAETIIKEIEDLKGLLGLYIYDDNMQKIPNERVEIEKTLEKLIPKIKEGFRTRSKLVNTFPSFATNFDSMDKSHLYNVHCYLKGLINFQNRKQAKRDFIKLARKIYQDKEKELVKFEDEYEEFNSEKILHWYTRDSPVYKLTNNCLRIASSDSILFSRFVLKDMEQAIREQYKENFKDFNGLVYRGAYISVEEWEKLERNIGEEIEMYGFLSTSVNKRPAVNFFKGDMKNKIFITIIVPPLPELDEQGFADVSKFSRFGGEQEILFNVRSKFRILEAKISKIDDRGTKGRHLVLLFGAQLLRRYMTMAQPVINVDFKLLDEVKCDKCGCRDKLFGLDQSEVLCADCLGKDQRKTSIFALDLEKMSKEKGTIVSRSFKGKELTFSKAITPPLPYYGYKCFNCQETGKEKYYKWVSLDGSRQITLKQCSECFKKGEKMKAEILISEAHPYAIWHESEAKWETVDSDYQGEFSQKLGSESQSQVYLEVQSFDLCVEYEKKVISKLSQKRRRERRKLGSFEMLGRGEQSLGNYKKALERHQKALDILIPVFGKEHIYNNSWYTKIASIYQDLGDYQKALDYHKKVLEINIAVFGEKNLETATAQKNIAVIYRNLGQYKQALEFYHKGLKITETIYGKTHPETAATYNAIAAVYLNRGDHKRALEYYEKAIEVRMAIYGEKHPHTAGSYNNIALVYERVGKYLEALEYQEKALEVRKSIYGEKHRYIAESFHNIASVYFDLGKHEKALEFHQKALEMRKEIFGEKHPDIAASYSGFAIFYKRLGKYKKALEYFTKALNIQREVFSENEKHPEIADSYNSIASVYHDVGDYEKALEFYEKALELRMEIFGEKHFETAGSYNNIALVYERFGKYQKALEYHQKALDIRMEIYGEKHPDIAASYNGIATAYKRLENNEQAVVYFTKALETGREFYGENHPIIASFYNNIGTAYTVLEENEKAIDAYQKALAIKIAIYGETNPSLVSSYNNLGVLFNHLEQHFQALECYQKALRIVKIVYGENSTQAAGCYTNIALALQSLGEYKQALENSKKAVSLNEIIFGKKHPTTGDSYAGLASLYQNLGEYQNSKKFYKKTLDLYTALYGPSHSKTLVITDLYNVAVEICKSLD